MVAKPRQHHLEPRPVVGPRQCDQRPSGEPLAELREIGQQVVGQPVEDRRCAGLADHLQRVFAARDHDAFGQIVGAPDEVIEAPRQ